MSRKYRSKNRNHQSNTTQVQARPTARRARRNFNPHALLNYFYGGGGAYEGAGSERPFRNWSYSQGVADAEILGDLDILRMRARDSFRNNAIARGVINTMSINIVGGGLKLQAAPDRAFLGMTDEYADIWEDNVERKFNNWAGSKACDAARSSTFYDLQGLAFLSYALSGEVFALLPILSRNGKEQLCVQLVEADLVQNGPGQYTGKNVRAGIEVDDYGAPLAYNIRTDTMSWTRVEAYGAKTNRPNVIHLFRQERPGQTHGVPLLASVLENIKQTDRYNKSALASAVVQSFFTAFIKTNNINALSPLIPGDPNSVTTNSTLDDDDFDYTLAPGAVLRLKPDEDVTFANPSQPQNIFEAFYMAQLMCVGMATNIPYEMLSKRFLASYSASRASRIEAWRYFLAERDKFNRDFNQVIFEEWLTHEILSSRIPALGFMDSEDIRKAYCVAEWLGSSMGQIDEQKEVNAAIMKINAGLSTRTAETAALNGGDFTRNIRKLRRELEQIGPLMQAPAPPPGDEPSDDFNQET